MKDYREKDVMGFIGDTNKSVFPKPCRITVRMTADKRGKTLSLAGANILIGIPLEDVEDIIMIAEVQDERFD
ncbi:MAG: hypothetical protein ILP14_06895 [Oscillospiraceae bacterium]|nr:hypothetical protein [Oscillospiraceae bacterium]